MIKSFIIDALDVAAAFANWMAKRWLRLSVWLADAAESVETGESISSIRKQRERDDDGAR